MSVVGFHIEPGAGYGHTAIDMTGGVIDKALESRTRMVPEYFSSLRVERKGIVRAGEVHDAIHHHGRRFKDARRSGMKDPLRLQLPGILRSDPAKTAVTLSGVVTVVRRPVVLNLRASIGARMHK